jgi:hypothetical protein
MTCKPYGKRLTSKNMAKEIVTVLNHLDIRNSNVCDGGTEEEEEEDVVNPWNVVSKSQTGVDYDKLISK